MANKYYFSTKDIVLIAILCCLGGLTSTYIGYIGSTFGSLTGIPMGGQALAGLHVFWIILIMAIVNKKCSGSLAGLLKGFVEFITGSHLGILAIPTSLLEGVFAEIGFWPFNKYSRTVAFVIAGGLGSWANVLVTQTIFNAFPGIYVFGSVSVFAFVSGLIFGGYMSMGIYRILIEAGVVKDAYKVKNMKAWTLISGAIVVILVGVLAITVAEYVTTPLAASTTDNGMTPIAGGTFYINITGDVAKPGSYYIPGYSAQFITISAVNSMGGSDNTYNFTGVPFNIVLKDAGIYGNASAITLLAADKYQMTYTASDVMSQKSIILDPENGEVDIIAKGYASDMWVKSIKNVTVS
jgi:energy-coupling factor transport system substrate-specific component